MTDASGNRPGPVKSISSPLTEGPDRAPARAMLKAVGFTDDDLKRPIIGIATTWIETMPCNLNQRELAAQVLGMVGVAAGLGNALGTFFMAFHSTVGKNPPHDSSVWAKSFVHGTSIVHTNPSGPYSDSTFPFSS
jgi:dihydroxyacid dehydratase/phosphogluconate dehydratase